MLFSQNAQFGLYIARNAWTIRLFLYICLYFCVILVDIFPFLLHLSTISQLSIFYICDRNKYFPFESWLDDIF